MKILASLAVQSCHGISFERKAVKGSISRLAYGKGSKTHEKEARGRITQRLSDDILHVAIENIWCKNRFWQKRNN
jgi:hypothetical protein